MTTTTIITTTTTTHTGTVCEREDVSVLWNHRVRTQREVMAKKNTRIYKIVKTYILIDAAIPADRNVTQKKT